MNDQQFSKFLKLHGDPGIKHTVYFPPEGVAMALDRPFSYDAECFKEAVEAYFKEQYGNLNLLTAAVVLCTCNKSFKNRLNGTIKDKWLSANVFKPIANDCVSVLESISDLKDYQKELIQVFKSFSLS